MRIAYIGPAWGNALRRAHEEQVTPSTPTGLTTRLPYFRHLTCRHVPNVLVRKPPATPPKTWCTALCDPA